MQEPKRRRGRPRKTPVPTESKPSKLELTPQQQKINNLSSLFNRIQQAQAVIEYRIRNYTEEDLERYLGNLVQYQSQLIDLNRYAYKVVGWFRELIDFYTKPILYRWTVGTRAKHYSFIQHEVRDQMKIDQQYIMYASRINKLNLGRELHRILITMLLEDAVFGYWVEEPQSSVIFYLPSHWCLLRQTVNGSWTYLLNTPRISQRDIERLPGELASLVRRYKDKAGEEALAPVPYEKVVCFKYNDHTNIIFPPFTYVLLLIIDLMKSKKLSITKNEQDAVNLIQMLIPINEDEDDHLRFTDPIIEKYAIGLQNLLAENNAILPTPMELKVLEVNKSQNIDSNLVENATDAFHAETGTPSFGGSNTAAEMRKAIENAMSKMYVLLDQISASVNLKMKLDGFMYNTHEFVYEIFHMTQFNRDDFIDNMLKQSQAGAVNKIALEAARGNDPSRFIGQHYLENVVFRNMFEDLLVPPSSHTQSGRGRPQEDESDLSESGRQARENDTNNPDNRA